MVATRDYHTKWSKSEKKYTNTIWYHLNAESKIWHKWTYLDSHTQRTCGYRERGSWGRDRLGVWGLEEGVATHSRILAWRIPMDRAAWRATVPGVSRVGHDWMTKHRADSQTYRHVATKGGGGKERWTGRLGLGDANYYIYGDKQQSPIA